LAYSADDVKRLRELTAAGMLDCKKALDEADGDFDKAVEIIRVKGLKGVTKREGRSTSNGLVTAKAEGDLGVMLELNCETDFVAKGERFQELADELLNHLVSSKIADLSDFLASKLASGKTVQERVDEGNATLGEKIEIKRISVLTGSPISRNILQHLLRNLLAAIRYRQIRLRKSVVLQKRQLAMKASQRPQSQRLWKVA